MAESFNIENACHPCCCQSSLRSLSEMISDYGEQVFNEFCEKINRGF